MNRRDVLVSLAALPVVAKVGIAEAAPLGWNCITFGPVDKAVVDAWPKDGSVFVPTWCAQDGVIYRNVNGEWVESK